jgi:hypothetical protein
MPIAASLMLVVGAHSSACDRSTPAPELENRAESTASRALLEASLEAGEDFTWDPVEGADRYRVRAWADDRLLFDVSTFEPRLASTPALERTLVFHPHAVLRIDALGPDGAQRGEVVEIAVSASRPR